MNRTKRLLSRLPSPVRRALLIGQVGNAIRGLNWLTSGMVVAAVASVMAGVWERWIAWPLIPQIGLVVGMMIMTAAAVGSVATALEDHRANKRRLPIAVQAHGMSHGWRPWGVHQNWVLKFQTLILTNRGDREMSVELGVVPFGAGVLHKHEARVTLGNCILDTGSPRG